MQTPDEKSSNFARFLFLDLCFFLCVCVCFVACFIAPFGMLKAFKNFEGL